MMPQQERVAVSSEFFNWLDPYEEFYYRCQELKLLGKVTEVVPVYSVS